MDKINSLNWMIGDKNVNNAKRMSEYRVKVNMDAKIALYINARSEEEAIASAEEIMYNHLEYSDVLRPSVPDGATWLDIDEVHCAASSAIEME